MIVYFDTSALIKLVFEEPGSDLAAELWDRAGSIVSSQLIYPEARAAVAAAHRAGRIARDTLQLGVKTIDLLCSQLSIIGLDSELAHSAGELAELQGLRGYDAVHLASALSVDSQLLLFATWDRDLGNGAVAAGCSVSPAPT
ncbi:type II toxin-antitoxin system VapC family toxin [Arthrobacter sp. H5]|uniref:type II toxin-antitoxin system VapC family toxin n=1 Tax=Arthrobacter sp. H5 TaxID=1267973 RepID=UPI00048874FC|nr:type II toxin-antitoxin system VapC family toxin [Arthrobacter sp. H5]